MAEKIEQQILDSPLLLPKADGWNLKIDALEEDFGISALSFSGNGRKQSYFHLKKKHCESLFST